MKTNETRPFKINLNLKQTKAPDMLTQIMLSFTVNRIRIRVYTKLRVEPKYWNPRLQRCDTSHIPSLRVLRRLRKINNVLADVVDSIYSADEKISQHGAYLTSDDVRDVIRLLWTRNSYDRSPLLFMRDVIEKYDSENNRRGYKGECSSKITYRTALSRLESFQKTTRFPLNSFDNFGKRFFESFTEYLYNYSYTRKGVSMHYTKNTVVNTIKVIKNLLHRAYDHDISENTYYNKIHTPLNTYLSEKVYLNEDEIKKIALVRVDTVQEKQVRDLFVIACYTALRVSDVMQLKDATISNGYITLYQVKTKDEVNIPILKEVAPLIGYYKQIGFPCVLPIKANVIIKYLTRRAGIDETVVFKENRGGKTTIVSKPKCDLVSFHTARRSCLTNLFKRGYSANYLMTLSGHHSILAFQRYLRCTSAEMAEKFLAQLRKDKAV